VDERRFEDSLAAIHEAGAGLAPWGRVLGDLSDALGAWGIQLIGIDEANVNRQAELVRLLVTMPNLR
jgi:hypothetical protein